MHLITFTFIFVKSQAIAHGEQVFPRVKEKCASKDWFALEDVNALEELVGRLRRLKDNVGFMVNRVTAIQAGLDSWQSEQINKKLYYLSFLSIIFLPLSIITGGKLPLQSEVLLLLNFRGIYAVLINNCNAFVSVFGMNVGGVPWTGQRDPELKDGFRNVMFLCLAMLFLILLCFICPYLYTRFLAWQRRRDMKRSWSFNKKSFLRTVGVQAQGRNGYLRI